MDKDKRKEYNKKYYSQKKDEIKAKLFVKEECVNCGRKVNHQNFKKHQTSKLCKGTNVDKIDKILNDPEESNQLKFLLRLAKEAVYVRGSKKIHPDVFVNSSTLPSKSNSSSSSSSSLTLHKSNSSSNSSSSLASHKSSDTSSLTESDSDNESNGLKK